MTLVVTMLMAGCGTKQTPETKPPATSQVGIIDINVAVKAHPKYKQLIVLEQQADAMAAKLEAEQLATIYQGQQMQNNALVPDMFAKEIDGLNQAAEQEDNTKLAAKERELQDKLVNKAKEINRTLDEEMNAYNAQIDKEYQPLIFNLQLKLKVVQLSKEEAASLQMELDKLQAKRSEALALKQEQLSIRMNELMAPEKAILGQEFETYRNQIGDDRAKQVAGKQAEIMNRGNEQPMPVATQGSMTNQIPEELAMKQQEIEALQGFILANITEKTGKVAAEGGFEIVLTHVVVNVSAVDITTQVITECNK